MFLNMLAIENTKLFKRLMLWIELGAMALLVAMLMIIVYVTLQTAPLEGAQAAAAGAKEVLKNFLTWPTSLLNSLGLATGNGLGGLLLIILVGAATAQEYTWRTLHLWLGRGVRRPTLIVAKFVSILLPALLLVLVPLLVGGAISAVFSLGLNGSLHLEQLNLGQLALSTLRTTYTLLPYGALAFLLAILSRSTVVAIGGGLAYALLLEGILLQILAMASGPLGKIGMYLPSGLANGVLVLNQSAMKVSLSAGGSSAKMYMLDPVPAAIGIALWTLLFLGLAMWIFQKQDLSE